MARSTESLQDEVTAMRRIERAYSAVESLPVTSRRRVFAWAREEYGQVGEAGETAPAEGTARS